MNKVKTASYVSRKRVTDPEEIRIAREMENDPASLSAKELAYCFYKSIGMDVDYDSIFADWKCCKYLKNKDFSNLLIFHLQYIKFEVNDYYWPLHLFF